MNDPFKPSPWQTELLEQSAQQRALMGGTAAMRAAGEQFLHKFPLESAESYRFRLKSAVLFDAFADTIEDYTSRIHRKPVSINEPSEWLKQFEQNVDRNGNDLNRFLAQVTQAALVDNITFIFVEGAVIPSGEKVSKADLFKLGYRPYFIHHKLENVIGLRTSVDFSGATVIDQARIAYSVSIPDGLYGETSVEQVRVYSRVDGGVYFQVFQKNEKGDAIEIESGNLGRITEIPLIPVYSSKIGFLKPRPILRGLADKCIEHWNEASDHKKSVHKSRVGFLFAKGVDIGDTKTIVDPLTGKERVEKVAKASTDTAFMTENVQADMKFVEASNSNIAPSRNELDVIKDEMRSQGMRLLVADGKATATGELQDNDKGTSKLGSFADGLEDSVEQAFLFLGKYNGLDTAAKIIVNKEFTVSGVSNVELGILAKMYDQGAIDHGQYILEMNRRGITENADAQAMRQNILDTLNFPTEGANADNG